MIDRPHEPWHRAILRVVRAAGWALALVALLGSGAALAQETRILGKVIQVRDGDLVQLDRGADHGVKERMVFDLYNPARVVTLPMSNEVAYVREVVVAQVVVVAVEGSSCTGRVVEVGGGIRSVPQAKEGARVVSNPYSPDINIPPFIRGVRATAASAAFGQEITITVDATDEKGDQLYFTWKATGGLLDHARSSTPTASWRAPLDAGKSIITVTAVDTAGNRTEKLLQLESTGPTSKGNVFKPTRVLGKHAGLFRELKDLAIDERNHTFVIEGSDQKVTEMDGDWVEVSVSKEPNYKTQIERAVAKNGFLYAVDRYETRAIKLRLGDKVLQDKPLVVYGQKGVGNGRFERPIDIAVDNSGRVYVLDGSEDHPAVHVFRESDGTFVASLGSVGDKDGQWKRPVGLDVTHQDQLVVLDDGRKKALVFEDLLLQKELSVGTGTDELRDLKVDPFTGWISVLDGKSGQVRSFTLAGDRVGKVVGSVGEDIGFGIWERPTRLRYGKNGDLYLISNEGTVVHQVDPTAGLETARWGGFDLSGTTRMAAGPNGEIALVVPRSYRVAVLDQRGWIARLIGGEGTQPGKFRQPVDAGFDAAGKLYVLDRERANVQQFDAEGKIQKVIGRKGDGKNDLDEPKRLTMSVARDRLAVLDDRDEWTVKIFGLDGSMAATFPEEDDLEDGLDIALTANDVMVAIDDKTNIRQYGTNGAEKAGWSISQTPEPLRIVVSNTLILFSVKSGSLVQPVDLTKRVQFQTIKPSKMLEEPGDVATDDYDRVFIWDTDVHQIVVFER